MHLFVRALYGFFAFSLATLYLLAPAALAFAQTTSIPPPTCYIQLNTSSISVGGSVTVSWSSTNATGGAITNIGNVPPSGSINLLPSSASYTTYVGAFTGPGGTANCQATLTVNSSGGAGANTSGNGGGTTVTPQNSTPQPTLVGTPGLSGGLVPCGTGGFSSGDTNNTRDNSTGCQACDLAQLIQNVITFAIGIAIPIAAALFAYAGFLFFTSAENPGNITKAKQIFKNAFVGFIIAITAWLIINTVLSIIFSGGPFSGGQWFTIQCSQTPRPANASISDVLGSLPITGGTTANNTVDTTGAPTTPAPANSITPTDQTNLDTAQDALQDECDDNNNALACKALGDNGITSNKLTDDQIDALSDLCDEGDTKVCSALDAALDTPSAPLPNTKGDCTPDALAADGWTNPNQMSCVTKYENGSCNLSTPSGTDIGSDGNSVSIGKFQINISANNLNYPACTALNGGAPLNCTSAFAGGMYTSKNHGTYVTNSSLYATCVAAASNNACNTAAAQDLLTKSNGSITPWGTAARVACGGITN